MLFLFNCNGRKIFYLLKIIVSIFDDLLCSFDELEWFGSMRIFLILKLTKKFISEKCFDIYREKWKMKIQWQTNDDVDFF